MEAKAYPLHQVLSLDRRFVVPTYQRDYEWTRDGQWQLLFDDLEQRADRLADARDRARAAGLDVIKAEKTVGPHFLGAIVLDQLPSSTGSIDVRAVIDGQQRLTTLQLLIRGVLDALAEIESPRGKQLHRMIQNPDDVSGGDDRYKLWPRRRDRAAWRVAMMPTCDLTSEHIYLVARRYFAQRARTFVETGDVDERASVLVDAVMGLLRLVVIDLEDNDDAQVIFEVLNGRQTPLSSADLVKNLLFLRIEQADGDRIDRLYDQYWADFDDAWWKREVGRGHAARRHSDTLLAAWLTAARGTESTSGRLYSEIRSYLDDRPDVVDVLAEISGYAAEYRVINAVAPEPDDRVRAAYERLNRLGVTTTQPLLLWLRRLRTADRINDVEHRGAVLAVESFVIRRMLIGAQTRGYGRAFTQVLAGVQRRFSEREASVVELVEAELRSKPQGAHWPSDEEVIETCTERRFYGVDSQERIRLLLSAIDESWRSANPKIEKITLDYHTLTIEHIMPQEWSHHWPVVGASDFERQSLAQRRETHVNRLGNLTLVTKSLNPALSNADWAAKRPEIEKNSVLALNADVASQESWDEEAIDDRSRLLGAEACKIFARPSVTSETELAESGGSRRIRPGAEFNWSLIDAAVERIPPGYWVTYGDLADLAATSPQSVGNRMSTESAPPHAYRVLDRQGRVSPDFRWADPSDTRDVGSLLTGEGIAFDADGRASASNRLSQYAIAQLIPAFFSEEDLERLANVDAQQANAGSPDAAEPWLIDGRNWHLWQRSSEKTRPMVEMLVELVASAAHGIEGPDWRQKWYLAWRFESHQWLRLNTRKSYVRLRVRTTQLGAPEVAKRLEAVLVAPGESTSTKSTGPIQVAAGRVWELLIIVKDPGDLAGAARGRLAAVLSDEWSSLPWRKGELAPPEDNDDEAHDDDQEVIDE